MNYYPQSLGPLSAPFVPYLDQLAVGNERVVYQPHLQTIVPSGGSIFTNRIPIHPPTITVQCETGMFACNYHELRKDMVPDEEKELVVPPWLERNPTQQELAVEERFRSQEEHWETKYWAGMEKKMKEAAKAQERVENGGRRPTVTANVLKPGVNTAVNSPHNAQRADSFRRVLKKDGSGSKSGAGHGTNYTGSECSTARPYLERKGSLASSIASKSVGGRGAATAKAGSAAGKRADDVRSIASSSNPRYRIAHDRTETESICSIISSVYSDDEVARRSAKAQQSLGNSAISSRSLVKGGGGAVGASGGLITGRSGGLTSSPSSVHNSASNRTSANNKTAGALSTSRTAKMSPRQRMLQQQQEELHRMSSSVSTSSAIVVVSPSTPGSPPAGGLAANNAAIATNGGTSSMTTPFASKCFIVAEGTEPFAWGSPCPIVASWLREVLDEGRGRGPTTRGDNDGHDEVALDSRAASPPAHNLTGVTPAPSTTVSQAQPSPPRFVATAVPAKEVERAKTSEELVAAVGSSAVTGDSLATANANSSGTLVSEPNNESNLNLTHNDKNAAPSPDNNGSSRSASPKGPADGIQTPPHVVTKASDDIATTLEEGKGKQIASTAPVGGTKTTEGAPTADAKATPPTSADSQKPPVASPAPVGNKSNVPVAPAPKADQSKCCVVM